MKKFVFGLIAGFILATMTTAFAMTQITAYFNPDIKININGTPLESEIVSVNETQKNYAPIRDIAEALGAYVEWNQATKTINITSKQDKESEVDTVNNTTSPANIKYDETTGLPIGAKYTDYKDCKALEYNNNIYISLKDLDEKYNIKSKYTLPDQKCFVFEKDNELIKIDYTSTENVISGAGNVYFNINLFLQYIGD